MMLSSALFVSLFLAFTQVQASASCSSSSIPVDPCIVGTTWTLDLPNTKALIEQHLTALSASVQVNDLTLTGSGTLDVQGSDATFVYDNLVISEDIVAEGINDPSTTTINGNFQADLYMTGGGGGSGTFCLHVTAGQGTAVETDPISGGLTVDLTPDGGFIDDTYSFSYTCGAGKLNVQGTLNGVTAVGPYLYDGGDSSSNTDPTGNGTNSNQSTSTGNGTNTNQSNSTGNGTNTSQSSPSGNGTNTSPSGNGTNTNPSNPSGSGTNANPQSPSGSSNNANSPNPPYNSASPTQSIVTSVNGPTVSPTVFLGTGNHQSINTVTLLSAASFIFVSFGTSLL